MLMTREMWWLGFYADRFRLALLLMLNFHLLVMLSRRAGFEETQRWTDDLRDAAIAYGIGILASGALLAVFGILTPGMPPAAVLGTIALQSVPASIGALLGRAPLVGEHTKHSKGPEQAISGKALFLNGL